MRALKGLLTLLTVVLVLSGCARGKIKAERTSLQDGAFSKSDTILVKPIHTENMQVTGDKADEKARIDQEKTLNSGAIL